MMDGGLCCRWTHLELYPSETPAHQLTTRQALAIQASHTNSYRANAAAYNAALCGVLTPAPPWFGHGIKKKRLQL